MTMYEWEATAKGNNWESEKEPETYHMRGDFETNEAPWHSRLIHTQAEKEAMEAAYRHNLDPDTVELTELWIIDEGPKRGWKR